MNIRTFEPANHIPTDERAAIILFNHVGSTIAQDTGRDAQDMADRFGVQVIAANRPGTGGILRNRELAQRLSTTSGYVKEMGIVGKQIDHEVDQIGVERLIAVGRSAGGLGALTLARSKTVGLDYLVVTEPVASSKMTVESGQKWFREYNEWQSKFQKADVHNVLIKPVGPGLSFVDSTRRIAANAYGFLNDQSNSKHVWASDAALEFMAQIAKDQPDLDTSITYAEHSLVASQEVFDGLVVPIANLRTEGAPFVVQRAPNTTHASFDNRDYMAQLVAPAVAKAKAS